MRGIKNVLKKILPESIVLGYQRRNVIKLLKIIYQRDMDRFFRYSNIFYTDINEKKIIGKIIFTYHVIEKGLSMPEMKLGFGRQKLILLIDECLKYSRNYDISNNQFLHALGVIEEYRRVHKQKGFKLDDELENKIQLVLNKINVPKVENQKIITRDDYYKFVSCPFDEFSESRKSVRNFNGTVELEDIEKAIDLAKNTPSSCNRQPTRVHVVTDKRMMKDILNIQNGNRGFGHLADKLILLTSDLSSVQGLEERNLPFFDGGMYAMNLIYALHFYKIATCPLNWGVSVNDDIQLRKLLPIPDNEEVLLIIACGKAPDEFYLASSMRYDYKEVTTIH